MRAHLSLKQIGPVIGVKETHVPQAIDPAVDKLARLFNRYPRETLAILMERAAELEPMSDTEITNRERVLNGRPAIHSAHR